MSETRELTHEYLDKLSRWTARRWSSLVLGELPFLVEQLRPMARGETLLEFRVPQITGVNQNARGHWQTKATKIRKERAAVALVLSQYKPPRLPVTVVMARCAPRLADDDNAVGSMKLVRDQVAAWLGIDDRDARVAWRVEQRKVPRKDQGVVIRVERRRA